MVWLQCTTVNPSVLGLKMPKRCVAAGCSYERNLEEGISLHKLPFYDNEQPKAKKRRKKWVDFVQLKRAKWEPSQSSVLCSEHFKRQGFIYSADLGDEKNCHTSKTWLKTDDLGVTVFPECSCENACAKCKPEACVKAI